MSGTACRSCRHSRTRSRAPALPRAVVARILARDRCEPEHADLDVVVAELRDLVDRWERLEAVLAIGAEEALRRVGALVCVSVPKKPATLSPRQCIAPCLTVSHGVCAVIVPVVECRFDAAPVPSMLESAPIPSSMLTGVTVTSPSKLPRSHASWSMSPDVWQLAHAAAPLEDMPSRRTGTADPTPSSAARGCAASSAQPPCSWSGRTARRLCRSAWRRRAGGSCRRAQGPRAPVGHVEVLRAGRRRIERVGQERRGVEHPDLARAERDDVRRRAIDRRDEVHGRREAVLRGACGRGQLRVVDVLVEMSRGDGAARQHGDARLREVALQRLPRVEVEGPSKRRSLRDSVLDT